MHLFFDKVGGKQRQGKKKLKTIILELFCIFSQALRSTAVWERQTYPCIPCTGFKNESL